MKQDIQNSNDIKLLINTFYNDVKKDAVIGFIFTDIISVNWEKHLPIMYSFWETILLEKYTYKGNPIKSHININTKIKLTDTHFKQWLKIWNKTINNLFSGPIAEKAKLKAQNMQQLMQIKILQSNDSNYIK